MRDKIKFKEILAGIVESAQVQGNKIPVEVIKDAFAEDALTEEQYEFVYSYLESEHITVAGHQKKEMPEKTEEKKNSKEKEETYLKFYLEELKGLGEYAEEEEERLLRAVLAGNEQARNQIIEGNLKKIVKVAEEFTEKGIPVSDLIQEGNIGFLTALEQLQEENIVDFDEYWKRIVRIMINDAINEQISSDRTQQRMVEKLNALDRATKELTKELERKVTVAEISEYMEISEEETEELLRISKQISDAEKHKPKL